MEKKTDIYATIRGSAFDENYCLREDAYLDNRNRVFQISRYAPSGNVRNAEVYVHRDIQIVPVISSFPNG